MDPVTPALSIIILLFSVIVHEVMHGVVALKFGDHTAERAGRLTLNPLPHIDPIGTILVPASLILLPYLLGGSPGFIIGWAKPVPVNPLNFTNLRKGEFFVSAAGIVANFSLAIVAAILFYLTKNFSIPDPLTQALFFMVGINILLALFNLLPIPPLDGSKILLSQLPLKLALQYQKLEQYGFLLLLVLLMSGMLQFIFPLAMTISRFILGF